jgi:hypothetical protein
LPPIDWPARSTATLVNLTENPAPGQAQSPKWAIVAGKFADREIAYCLGIKPETLESPD